MDCVDLLDTGTAAQLALGDILRAVVDDPVHAVDLAVRGVEPASQQIFLLYIFVHFAAPVGSRAAESSAERIAIADLGCHDIESPQEVWRTRRRRATD